jgi:4-amino-4-deoxy-L-arabinose transferase-like glycosyltransferase
MSCIKKKLHCIFLDVFLNSKTMSFIKNQTRISFKGVRELLKTLSKKVQMSTFFKQTIARKNRFSSWVEIHPWKTLMAIYFVFSAIKIIISQIYLDPSNLVDGFIYLKMAGSFFENGSFSIYGEPTHQYPPLYPILISPAYIFNDSLSIFRMARVLSVFYSTLIIFPAFLITREFLNNRKSLLIACIISGLAGSIIWIYNLTSECLFYPLFLLTIFFLYKAYFETGHKFKILSGFFIGLCFLIKYTSVVLIPVSLFFFVIMILYEKKFLTLKLILNRIKDWIVVLIAAFVVVFPWLIRNGMSFGFSIRGILGYTQEISNTVKTIEIDLLSKVQNILLQEIIGHGALILSTGIIFFICAFWLLYQSFKHKTKKIFALSCISFLSLECLILLTAIHNINLPWRLHTRYIEPLFPLILILGLIGLLKIKKFQQRNLYVLLLTSFIVTLVLANTWGYMGGMISLPYIGIIQNFSTYLNEFFGYNINGASINSGLVILFVITILYTFFFVMIKVHISKKKIFVAACLIIFISTTISTVGYIARDAYTSKSDLYECGNWLNKRFSGESKIIFLDENIGEGTNLLAVWINAPMLIGKWNITNNTKISYLISTDTYNYTLIYSKNISAALGENFIGRYDWQAQIFVYKLNEEKQ